MFADKSIPRIFPVLFVIVFMLAVTPRQAAHAAGVRYAKPAASGAGDCSSWANACTLQTALTGAVSGDEIWAAAGTHKPTTGTYRIATFQLKSGVALYGGFAGTETARDQRNPAVNVTILSGDLNGDDVGFTNNWENVYHVVTGATGATLDGFTITAGAANSFDTPNNRGGGMYNSSGSSPALTNVTFSGNWAFWGGGMYNDSSSPTLTNVTFSGNRGNGGGMYNSSSSPTLTNVIFSGNWGDGGGMYNTSGSNPTLTNVTFSGNRGWSWGGGMYNTSGSNPTLVNSILWGDSPDEIYNDGSAPIITYSDVYTPTGVYSGTGNINADPRFVAPITATAAPTTTGSYRLYACSPAIDAGNSSAIAVPTDLDGNPRVMGAAVDMGAYETAPAPIACLRLTKSVAPSAAAPGDLITYTLTFRNKGPVNTITATAVIITDVVPISVTNTSVLSSGAVITRVTGTRYAWQVQDLAPGQGGVITIAGHLGPAPHVSLNILNTAVITTGVADGYPADNTSAATVHIPGVIYVDHDAPGPAHNGLSWTTAYTGVQQALTAASSGDEIWVAAGTYKPTTGTDRFATFQLKSGVALYGGFVGTETARDQRNPAINVTILSGDIDSNDSQTPIITDLSTVTGNTTNSCQVVTGATGATLDGFTITAAYANQWAHDSGGGMVNTSGSSPTLTNVTFSGNWAYYGGGMYNSSSSPTLTNVTFSGNWAHYDGGGMYNTSGSNPTLTNVTFNSNKATQANYNGGGMYNTSSNPVLMNVAFSGNSAGYDGGGMYNLSSSPTLTNVTFSGNSAFWSGGGLYNTAGSNPTLTNVTFSGNTTSLWGGGMYNDSSSPTLTNVTFGGNSGFFGGGMYNLTSTLTIRNTIFWSNSASGGAGAQIYNNAASAPVVSDSVVQGGCPAGSTCTNIITADPKLGPLGDYGYGGSTQTIPILPGSSAVDTGNDAICPATDQRGLARPQGAHCDIGAYEYDYLVFPIYYVKPVASGNGNCTSWANACPLPSALGLIPSGDEIWVASGTYKPTTTPSNRTATFQLKSGVALYGGFAGTEMARDQRNPAVNVTILSGDIDNNDSQTPIITDLATVTGNTTNSYHVISGTTGATLDGFIITAGYAISIWAGDPDSGSGMYNTSVSSLTLANITFSGNSAKYGGGMYNSSSSPALTNVAFSSNSADDRGGGMYNTSGSNPTLANVTFSGNSAWSGGGMWNASSDPILTNVTFSGNSAYRGGGAINWTGGGMGNVDSSPALANVTFSGNSAYNGGGMYNSSGSPALTNVTFNGNTATQTGGGMYNTSGSNPVLTNVSFNGNTATLFGGGMINNTSSPMLTNVTFSNNSANYGGGMLNNTSSKPTLTNITFNGNTATNDGGGMYNSYASPTLTNVTFSGNSANYGGAMNNLSGTLKLTNITFSGNSASQKGGGMHNTSGSPTIRNTIFWGNTASSAGAQIFNNGSSPVVSDTVVQAGCPAGSTCRNIITADPRLGTLGNYGGSTQTIPLLPGSSAIDTGNDATCPATDQRGVARPQGAHCDIGAYEYYALDTIPPIVNSIARLNPSPTNLASVGFKVTLSEFVTGVKVSDFVLTTTGITGASVTIVSSSGSVYTVTVDTGSGTGTLRLDVTDDDSIVDLAGNPLGGTGAGNGNFTGGETYDVRFHLLYLPLVLRNWP